MRDTKAQCNRQGQRSGRLPEAAEYSVTRAAGSVCALDLVGVSATDVVRVQAKFNRPPATADRETLTLFTCPPNCRRQVHVWRDRPQRPEVTEL